MFHEGREDVHDKERSGRTSLVNDDFVPKVNERFRDEQTFRNFWSVPALSSDFKDSMTLSVDIWVIGGRNLTISASVMAANMWKNSLKNVEFDNNKILYEILLDIFLQRNGSYFLNQPCSPRKSIISLFPRRQNSLAWAYSSHSAPRLIQWIIICTPFAFTYNRTPV